MATRKSKAATKRTRAPRESTTEPKFPYTTRPAALRKFLEQVPKRPRPSKINQPTLNSWDIKGGDANTIIRVLKTLGLVSSANEPTESYTQFMHAGSGPAVLAQRIRDIYRPLFEHSLEPHRESNEALKNLFNIHSGGAERTVEYQIQTFKALCDYADFTASGIGSGPSMAGAAPAAPVSPGARTPSGGAPGIHIDLHIHLPENKSRRDYEYMFEDIARYIYQRTPAPQDTDDR